MNRASIQNTLVIQAKAAPFKTGLLGVLAVVLLVLVGRLVWGGGPSNAEAFLPLEAGLSLNPAPAAAASALEQAPEAAPLRRPPLPDLPDTPARDLFTANWLTHGQVSPVEAAVWENEDDNLPVDVPVLLLGLTLTEQVDEGQHCAVINGRRVQVGSVIGEFVVESITPGLVILSGSVSGRIAIRMD